MLHWDVFNGVSRRAWAGNDNALSCTAAEQRANDDFAVQYPHRASEATIEAAIRAAVELAK